MRNPLTDSAYRLRFNLARPLQISIDFAILLASFVAAYMLRFDFQLPPKYAHDLIVQAPYVVVLQIAMLVIFGVYAFLWRYVGMAEVRWFLFAAVGSLLVVCSIRLFIPGAGSFRVPLSVALIDALLGFGGVLSVRVLLRALHDRTERSLHPVAASKEAAAILLIGAGQAGVLASREIMRRPDTGLHVKGFVDDDPRKRNAVINGVRVVGTTDDLPRLIHELAIDQVVITIAQASRADMTRIVSICESIPIPIRIVPGLYDVLQGKVEISRVRNIDIEDLLGRQPVDLDGNDIAGLLANKVVMVTGAGGSIGSELARQVARSSPASLLLVERAEFALFDIHCALRECHPALTIEPLVADAGDEARMRRIFARFHPDVVIHAAAHKHVPMMELQPSEVVKNNVLTTRLLGGIAAEFGAEAFILISTDKAVNPTSVMGASKRVAELVIQGLAQAHPETRFLGVRFGNVMGSTGSVIPIFRRQIAAGGPVTVTHPEMTRYFMTIPEAAQLVLQAAAIGEGGEIFVLDMGQPVRILDLATQMIKLSGLRPHKDIEIVFTGMRPGEKLYEELDRMGETISRTKHPKIFNGNLTPYPRTELSRYLQKLGEAARNGFDVEVRRILVAMLPEANLEKGNHVQDDLSDLPGVADLPTRDFVVADARIALKGERNSRNDSVKLSLVSTLRVAD